MKDLFEIAGGSVPGRWHIETGRNNQDAKICICTDRVIGLVVTDGCSGGAFSEVGARIGASLVATSLVRYATRRDTFWQARLREASARQASELLANLLLWERVRQDVLAQIRVLANAMGDNFSQVILDHFLFTIVGALIAEWGTYVFSIGDGAYALNGEIHQIGPFPSNEPPYMAYALTGSKLTVTNPDILTFQVHEALPTSEVTSLLVGTDGILDFIAAEEELVPGKKRPVGPLSQFWEVDRFFKNADHARRVLAALNQTVKKPDWGGHQIIKHIGFLTDDTTLVVARRKLFDEGGL